ncbi:MAG: hypothetical protein QM741_16605 [Rudaea sp.]|uniref:hypothetical protein n=1 Tax=Rudaea sp. TaxID=2136325 RepID=UPI0039E2F5E5
MLRKLMVSVLLSVLSSLASAAAREVPQYRAVFDAGAQSMRVRVCLHDAHAHVVFTADSAWAKRFVADVARDGHGTLISDDGGWNATDWRAGECLSYRADLAAIAAEDRSDVGRRFGEDSVRRTAVVAAARRCAGWRRANPCGVARRVVGFRAVAGNLSTAIDAGKRQKVIVDGSAFQRLHHSGHAAGLVGRGGDRPFRREEDRIAGRRVARGDPRRHQSAAMSCARAAVCSLRRRHGIGWPKDSGAAQPGDDTLERTAATMQRTHAYQRVYWAGAAFWLTVDRDLRRESGGKVGLDTVLSRFRGCCLPAYRPWRPEEFVARLDALAKTSLISTRYREFAAMTAFPDWAALYADLGIREKDGRLVFDPLARDAAIREAIMLAKAD